MSGDRIDISGTVTGSNVGRGNVIHHAVAATTGTEEAKAELRRLLDDARAEARRLSDGTPGRDGYLQELDGVEHDVEHGADTSEVTGRLERLKVWAEVIGLASTAAGIVSAVRSWFGAGS